jgi:hypothetical protein
MTSDGAISSATRRSLLIGALAMVGVALPLAAAAPQGSRPCGSGEPINTLRETWEALYACWQPPAGSQGMEITLMFSLRRDGTLIGKPRATWSKLSGSTNEQRAFVASVLTALEQALPLPLTDAMGGAVAGRPLALRFSVAGGGPIRSL